MKRIVSLVLLLAMVVLALASCGPDYFDNASSYLQSHPLPEKYPAVSLVFYIRSAAPVADEDRVAMQDAFNSIVESKFNVHVEFKIYDDTEYQTKLDEALSTDISTETASDSINGVGDKKFPGVKEHQVDIFLSLDYDKLEEYTANGKVADISYYVTENMKQLTGAHNSNSDGMTSFEYPKIPEVIFNNAYYSYVLYTDDSRLTKISDTTIYNGIPNSYTYGKYDFLVLDKAYVDKYYLKNDFFSGNNATIDAAIKTFEAELAADATVSDLDTNKENYILKVTNAKYADKQQYADSTEKYVIDLVTPTEKYSKIYSNMMCVTLQNPDITGRAFDVLLELNTNPLLHTILQYGAPSKHWNYVNDDDSTDPLEERAMIALTEAAIGYSMDVSQTGNFFTLFPCQEPSVAFKSAWIKNYAQKNEAEYDEGKMNEYTEKYAANYEDYINKCLGSATFGEINDGVLHNDNLTVSDTQGREHPGSQLAIDMQLFMQGDLNKYAPVADPESTDTAYEMTTSVTIGDDVYESVKVIRKKGATSWDCTLVLSETESYTISVSGGIYTISYVSETGSVSFVLNKLSSETSNTIDINFMANASDDLKSKYSFALTAVRCGDVDGLTLNIPDTTNVNVGASPKPLKDIDDGAMLKDVCTVMLFRCLSGLEGMLGTAPSVGVQSSNFNLVSFGFAKF